MVIKKLILIPILLAVVFFPLLQTQAEAGGGGFFEDEEIIEKTTSPQVQTEIPPLNKVIIDPEIQQIKEPAKFINPLLRVGKAIKESKKAVEVGTAGGTGGINLGLVFPFSPQKPIFVKTAIGFGVGDGYSVSSLQGQLIYKPNPVVFAGISADVANYSSKVMDLPGIKGIIKPGISVGIGYFVGRTLGKLYAKLGYSSVLGILGDIGIEL